MNPTLIISRQFKKDPLVSIVMPVYCQETLIIKNLQSVMKNTFESFEILLIDDASNDKTLENICSYLSDICEEDFPSLTSIRVFQNHSSKFETWCDDYLIRASSAPYVLEIQADMEIQHPGFDSKLVEAMKANADIIGISGRGVERISNVLSGYSRTIGSDRAYSSSMQRYVFRRIALLIRNQFMQPLPESSTQSAQFDLKTHLLPSENDFKTTGNAGRLGSQIDSEISISDANKRVIYVGETIMRGPLIIDRKKYFEVGGLDTKSFFQGYDDHDFFARSQIRSGYHSGFTPIRFSSPLQAGTTRRKRSLATEMLILKYLIRINRSRHKSMLSQLINGDKEIHVDSHVRRF